MFSLKIYFKKFFKLAMDVECGQSSIFNNSKVVESHIKKFNPNLHTQSYVNGSTYNSNGNLSRETIMDNDPLKIYFDLQQECQSNHEFFKSDNSEKGKRLYNLLGEWIENIKKCKESIKQVSSFMGEYDFDEDTPGNGYRSFVRVTEASISHGLRICKSLTNSRGRILFRKGYYVKEIESCNSLQESLKTCLEYLFILKELSSEGDLFANDNVEALFEKGEIINQHSFYGRCLGFQYRKTIQSALRFISITMAGFSESYYSNGGRIAKTTSSVWTGGKYFLNPELRARRIVSISQNATIDFCKSFWFLAESELMHAIPTIVGCAVKVNTVINIPPEPIVLQSENEHGKLVHISFPTIHLGAKKIPVRLLSTERYKRMLGLESKNKNLNVSKNLLFHCHGGGFVAQSSKSHELYLRDWAAHIKAPILSVDYSLAPEAPFPRALEEVFFAYCWALKNAEIIGWSGENIVVAGDSAGANLVLGVTLKCLQLGIRKPNGIFLSYCPTLVNFIPSPARLLCLMDPILPFGFMMRCLKAYACPSGDANISEDNNKIIFNDLNASEVNSIRYTANCSSDEKLHNNSASLIEGDSKFAIRNDEGVISPFSDGASDTFASASINEEKFSRTAENTELSENDISSCTSFEDDSQPITHMPLDSVTSCSKSNEKLNETEECVNSSSQKCLEQKNLEYLNSENKLQSLNLNNADTFLKKDVQEDRKNIASPDSIQSKFNSAVSSFSSTLNKFIGPHQIEVPIEHKTDYKKIDALIARNPNEQFIFEVPKNPLLSPYYTNDEYLIQYPSIKILTVDMDPCLDDCVMFAKKLKRMNVDVTLDILEGLPHGFLNFTMMSSEAMEASKMCASHIAELFANCQKTKL